MSKLKLTAAALFLTLGLLPAQEFKVKDNAVNLGIGFGTALSGTGSGRPAFSASFESGIVQAGPGVIGIGAYAGMTGFTYKSADYEQKWNYTIIGARGAYHFNGFNVPKLDPYGGLMLGYNMVSYKHSGGYDIPNSYGSGFGYSFFVGSRYFFSDNLAVFGELGYGISILNAGIALKF